MPIANPPPPPPVGHFVAVEELKTPNWPKLYLFNPPHPDGVLNIHEKADLSSRIVSFVSEKSPLIAFDRDKDWIQIQYMTTIGWVPTTINNIRIVHKINRKTNPAYMFWQGNNVFCFNGHMMIGSSYLAFTSTNIFITTIMGMSIFAKLLGYYGGFNTQVILQWGCIRLIMTVVLYVMVMASLWITASMDPGIIPRRDHRYLENTNGHLKYCHTCRIFRPHRAKHCRSCDNCVEVFDHHCPWIGNCLGIRNYRFYILFLLLATTMSLHLLIDSSLDMKNCSSDSLYPYVYSLNIFISIIAVLCLTPLTIYHLFLVASGETTNERVNQKRKRVRVERRNICASIAESYASLFCVTIPASKIPNLRESITLDMIKNSFENV